VALGQQHAVDLDPDVELATTSTHLCGSRACASSGSSSSNQVSGSSQENVTMPASASSGCGGRWCIHAASSARRPAAATAQTVSPVSASTGSTEQSRRTLALPAAAVHTLRALRETQAEERHAAGEDWQHTGLVFTTHLGAALDAGNVRKMFKRVCDEAGIGDSWTPRELRTSFVSLMSHQGVSIEEIARLVGHATTRTTEIVYRRALRPVITTGAEVMDELFTGT